MMGPVDPALRNYFPDGTEVLSAEILDDVATVNLSPAFSAIKDTPEMEDAALQCIQLTAQQFGTISSVKVEVDGKLLKSNVLETMAMPAFVNEYR
jgi:spore germination protein GerM